jgi:hypothetical protein
MALTAQDLWDWKFVWEEIRLYVSSPQNFLQQISLLSKTVSKYNSTFKVYEIKNRQTILNLQGV